ncbi:hypothetical protein ACHAXT_003318 [Thalassiosira profunda]
MGLLGNPVDRLPIRGRKQWATNLLLISLGTEYLGASITVPILAQYAASFDVDRGVVGLVFSVGSFATLLSDMWLPRVSDVYGRKRAIVLSLVGSSVAYAMEAAAPSFAALLVASFVGGSFGGTPPVAVAYISDIFSPAERPQYIGYVPAVVSACFVLGPTVGGFIANAYESFRIPIAVSAAVCGGLALPIVLFYVPDSKQLVLSEEKKDIGASEASEKEQELSESRRSSVKVDEPIGESASLLGHISDTDLDYPGPWKDWRCWVCLLISLLSNTVLSCFVTSLPLVLDEPEFGLASEHDTVFFTGLVLGCGAIVQAFGLAFLFNVVQKKAGLVRTVQIGTSISLAAYIFISRQTTVLGMGLGFGLFTLGNCLTRPGYTTFLTNIVPTEFTARAIAMPTIAASVAGLLSPIASTELLAKTNHHVMYLVASGVLFVQLVLVLSALRGAGEGIVVDKKATKATGDYEEAQWTEEQFIQELVGLLKHRHYNLNCAKSQKIIMAIAERSFPYLGHDDDGEELKRLLLELKIADCNVTQCKMRRQSIARRVSCKLTAAQLTQLGK